MTDREATQALNRWSRQQGYADFETYVAAGGGILMARHNMIGEMNKLQDMIAWLGRTSIKPPPETEDEPTDPANAHIQGAES